MNPAEYKLPVAIVAALSTDRPEMCALYETDDEEKREMARLIGDLVKDRARLKAECHALVEKARSAMGGINAVIRHADNMLAAAHGSEPEDEYTDLVADWRRDFEKGKSKKALMMEVQALVHEDFNDNLMDAPACVREFLDFLNGV